MVTDRAGLAALLGDAYGLVGARLRSLAGASRPVFRVTLGGAGGWVLRVYPPGAGSDAQGDAAVLGFLQRRGYPAERVVPTRDGRPVARTADGSPLLLTTFVAGRATGFTAPALRLLGAAVGRLHALPLDGTAPLRRATMLPRGEVAYARSCLASVAGRVPRGLRRRYAEVERALEALEWCGDLPDVLIHNDCHPGNSVRTPEGEAVLIDWDGAGRGPAVVDLGFLFVSCEASAFGPNRLPPDPRRLAAVVDGYREHRTPSADELDRLPSAIRFRSLVAAAGSLARRAEQEGPPGEDEPWWWRRFLAADEIAERARRHFEATEGRVTDRTASATLYVHRAGAVVRCRFDDSPHGNVMGHGEVD
jgi:Ser/Thr protein kinase RdoA (MazF antagonist)